MTEPPETATSSAAFRPPSPPRRVRGARVGPGGDHHADVAGDRGSARAEDEGDAGFPRQVEVGPNVAHDDEEKRDHADERSDVHELALQESLRPRLDEAAKLLHALRAV
jgi:hypothetical protein